jgi:hypothetical protein
VIEASNRKLRMRARPLRIALTSRRIREKSSAYRRPLNKQTTAPRHPKRQSSASGKTGRTKLIAQQNTGRLRLVRVIQRLPKCMRTLPRWKKVTSPSGKNGCEWQVSPSERESPHGAAERSGGWQNTSDRSQSSPASQPRNPLIGISMPSSRRPLALL